MKKILKLKFILIVFILFVSTSVSAAVLLSANEVSYKNSSGKSSVNNTKDALDELYQLSKIHCPDGYVCYRPVEYVENVVENSYIDTGYTINYNDSFTIEYDIRLSKDTGNYFFMGANAFGQVFISDTSISFREDTTDSLNTFIPLDRTKNIRFSVEYNGSTYIEKLTYNNNVYTFDWDAYYDYHSESISSKLNDKILIGALGNYDYSLFTYGAQIKIYSYKLIKNGKTVIDAIPVVRVNDDVAGLYNLIDGLLLTGNDSNNLGYGELNK